MKPLDTEVRDLLHARRGDWETVSNGADVSHSWLSQFYRGKIPNPGFATLSRLRAFLVDGAVAPRQRAAKPEKVA